MIGLKLICTTNSGNTEMTFHRQDLGTSLWNDEILDRHKLRTFADDKMKIFVQEIGRFPPCFLKPSTSRS